MNTKFVQDFPKLTAFAIDQPPPSDEDSGVTGWNNYAEEIANIFRCNTEDLRYLNSEMLESASEQEEFSSLEKWCHGRFFSLVNSKNIEACIDGEFETLLVECYYYQTSTRGIYFARVKEMNGEITAYFFRIQFLTDDVRNFSQHA